MGVSLDITLEELHRKRGAKWTTYDRDVIPAWVADMDFPLATPVIDAINDVTDRQDLGYPGPPALEALPEAFAGRMRERFAWEPDPAGVLPVGDLIQAMIAAVASFAGEGEGVVIQTPIYYPFLQIVALLGRRLVENPLVAGAQRYEMDLDHLRSVIDERTRLVLFCNPHNPTGRVFERRELEGLAEIALEHDLLVVSDEIHADLAHAGHAHVPFASLGPEIAARTITLTGAGKAFNIAGLKCALIHFGTPELKSRQSRLFSPYLLGTPNILGLEATLSAWRDGSEWLDAVVRQLEANCERVDEYLGQHLPAIGHLPAEASYFAWLDCAALELPSRPQEFFLERARVAFNDGRPFGDGCDRFARLNFATPRSLLDQILERMRRSVEAL